MIEKRKGQELWIDCCGFFLFLVAPTFLFVFFYHAAPTTVLLVVVGIAMSSFVPLVFNTGDLVVITPVGPLLAAVSLACCVTATLAGLRSYYAHVMPMRSLLTGRQYNLVYPQLPAVAFADAAFMTFVNGTYVDVPKAVSTKSLQSGLDTFCVAPVLNAANNGRVEFWAVGVDCCGDDGSTYDCDDAKDRSALNAWVMKEANDWLYKSLGKYIAPPINRGDLYRKAVEHAEHVHGLVTDLDNTMLVRWTKRSRNQIIRDEAKHVAVTLIITVVCGIFMALGMAKLQSYFMDLRRLEESKELGEDKIVDESAARLQLFLRHVDAQWKEMQSHADTYRPKLSEWDVCLMGVLLPFMVLMLSLLMGTYSGCWRNGLLFLAPFLVCLSLLIFFLLCHKGHAVTGLCLIMCAAAGFHTGFTNYENNMFHYCSIEDKRTYSDVLADAASKEYRDAGKLNFQNSAQLSQEHSVGFLYQDVTYCVAPIISSDRSCVTAPPNSQPILVNPDTNGTQAASSSLIQRRAPPMFLQRVSHTQHPIDIDLDNFRGEEGAEEVSLSGRDDETMSLLQQRSESSPTNCAKVPPSRVEFWAIGTNCCDARGNFNCDDGKDASARAGLVIRQPRLWAAEPEMKPDPAKYRFPNDNNPANDKIEKLEMAGEYQRLLKKAVDQSVAAYNLPISPSQEIMFVRWGKDADKMQGGYKWRALGSLIVTGMLSLIIILVISLSFHFYMKAERRAELKERERERRQESKSSTGFLERAREQLRV